jgi:membrane protein DedA with SNARE-associated domain
LSVGAVDAHESIAITCAIAKIRRSHRVYTVVIVAREGGEELGGKMHQLLLHWGYLALFVMCIVSSAGIPLGTEFAIGYGGALASGRLMHDVHLQLPLVILVATLGEVCGSLLSYGIGRYGGRELVDRFGKYLLVTKYDLDRAERFFARHGGPTVVFGRLIPVIRSFVSLGPGLADVTVLMRRIAAVHSERTIARRDQSL